MTKLIELRRERGKALDAARKVNDKAATERRNLTTAEQAEYDSKMSVYAALGKQIEREERLQREELRMEELVEVQADQDMDFSGNRYGDWHEERGANGEPRIYMQTDTGQRLRCYRNNEPLIERRDGDDGLDFYRAIVERCTGARLLTPERRSVQVDADVPGGFASHGWPLYEHARARMGPSLAGATTLPVRNGLADVNLALVTGDPGFSWARELEEFPLDESISLGSVKLSPKKVITPIEVSYEAMKSPNIANLLKRLLSTALAAELDRVALTGSGAGAEPKGVVNTPGILTDAVTSGVGWDDLLDAYGALLAVNVAPKAMIVPPAVHTLLSKLKDGEGRYYASPPGDLASVRRISTSKMTAGTAIMGSFEDLILAPFGQVEIEIQKNLPGRKGAFLIEVVAYFDCAVVWPGHFHALTGITA